MNIREMFIRLTQYTYPYKHEHKLKPFLPEGINRDEHGNYFLIIPGGHTMFTCHLDTCSYRFEEVNHVFSGEQWIQTDGTTVLGADDKAGMTVLLYMIEQRVPGLYYFFVGEEVGGVGSTSLVVSGCPKTYKKCVSFDRRGYDSVITRQKFGPCCSEPFAQALSKALNQTNPEFKFKPDATGVFTDSAVFTGVIPECTNISVGYFFEHSEDECQDILFLEKLCHAVVKVDWSALPIVRRCGHAVTLREKLAEFFGFIAK